jgi:hypothetical protein
VRSGPGEAGTILLLHIISARPSKQTLMVRTFLKVYMELGSYLVSARITPAEFAVVTETVGCRECDVTVKRNRRVRVSARVCARMIKRSLSEAT